MSPYKQISDSTYAIGTAVTANVTTPILMAPITLTASNNRLNEVYITWTPALDINAANRNIEGQVLTVQGYRVRIRLLS